MIIEIKKSEKPVIYEDAKKLMEERLLNVDLNKSNELIWTLEHPDIYTAGTSYNPVSYTHLTLPTKQPV